MFKLVQVLDAVFELGRKLGFGDFLAFGAGKAVLAELFIHNRDSSIVPGFGGGFKKIFAGRQTPDGENFLRGGGLPRERARGAEGGKRIEEKQSGARLARAPDKGVLAAGEKSAVTVEDIAQDSPGVLQKV